jgi:hypothetical protein
MNSIADALALTPGPSWHESVAIVQEIAATLQPDQPLPAAEDLLLEADGRITFGFAGESTRSQVADLASLLASLLEKTDAPHALKDLATENARDQPAHTTIASFARALAFYERPNRRADLQALAGRLEGKSHEMQAERVLAELRERVARKNEEEKPQKRELPQSYAAPDRSRNLARARAVAIGVAVSLAAVAVSAMTMLRGWNRAEETVQAAAAPAAALPDQLAEKATDAVPAPEPAVSTERPAAEHRPVGTSASSVREVPRPAARASAAPVRNPRSVPDVRPHAIKPVAPLPAARPQVLASGETRPRVAGDAPAALHLPERAPANGDGTVYSSNNADVSPPVWTRRQLPSEPEPDSQTGYFDIVIDTNGDVESVRLISPTRRYEERMLLAAAKAWKFRPARLNGQPVRYQMRVPITLTWTLDR